MNKLKRDIKLRAAGLVINVLSFIGLGIFKLIQLLSGLAEQEFYKEYPESWGIVVVMGIAFVVSIFFAVLKTLAIHPNIQLRSKPNHFLESIIADPEYELWHQEAQRLLDERNTIGKMD